MVVEKAFMSSEHHVACRRIKDVVCYRDVPSAVSYLLVRVVKDSEVIYFSPDFSLVNLQCFSSYKS